VWGYEDELRFNRDQAVLGYRGHFEAGTLEGSATRITTETLGRTLPAGRAPDYGYEAQGGEPRLLENRDVVVDGKWIMSVGDHMLTLGGQHVDSRLEDGAAGSQAFEQSNWSVFVEDEWWLGQDLALTLGARYENHDAFGGHFSPRVYLVWNADDQWTLKGGVGRGYKTPTLNQLHDGITGFTNQGRTITIGSPHLKPEKTTNYELGASFDNRARLSMDATLFHTRFTDRIASGEGILNCQYVDENGNQPYAGTPDCLSIGNFTEQEDFAQSVNIDRAISQGVELSAHYRFAPAWEISGGYTYTDTEIRSGDDKGLLLTNTPEHALTTRLLWDVSDRLSARLDGEFYSSRERFAGGLPTSGQNLSLYQQLGNKLDSYAVFNLGATYRASDRVRLTGTVYNLLDKDFGASDTYEHSGQTFHAYRYTQTGRATDGVYLDRRSLWLSATYDF
jgi:outer membrane receptor for ferrienterochelin and colicins